MKDTGLWDIISASNMDEGRHYATGKKTINGHRKQGIL